MLTEHSFDAGTVALNIAEGPDNGPPLVLLHGGSGRWQAWDPIIPDLIARWQLFAPDLRGHARSGRVTGRYAIRDYAGDIARCCASTYTSRRCCSATRWAGSWR
jgi:pimeloyl-ACP methyl ester carboxylesterase